MCLCLLTDRDRYFTIDLLGEYIFLTIDDDGQIEVREIYDVFFTPRGDWSDFGLVCLSPHDLVSGGGLAVQPKDAPGLRPEDKIIYNAIMGCNARYEPNSQIMSATVPGVTDRLFPTQERHSGTVLNPECNVPNQILQDATALDVMIESGTVFEMALGNVRSGTPYALRLEIKPYALLGLPDRASLHTDPYPQWSQEASISGPKLCHFDLCSTLDKIQSQQQNIAAGAAIVRGTISNEANPRVPVPLKHHRILLISESSALVNPRNPIGTATYVGAYNIGGQKAVTEWAGGTRTYWTDDIEATSERVWLHLSQFGAAEPKSKEAITTALGTPHVNCALIVDGLKEKGAVQEVGANLYRTVSLSKDERRLAFQALATDEGLIDSFRWSCYQISYLTVYRYVSRQDSKRLWWRRVKETWAFWLAVLGVILSLLSLFIQGLSSRSPPGEL